MRDVPGSIKAWAWYFLELLQEFSLAFHKNNCHPALGNTVNFIKNIFFVLALLSCGCNGADARFAQQSKRPAARSRRFFPEEMRVIQEPPISSSVVPDGSDRNVLYRVERQAIPIEVAVEQWKQRRSDKFVSEMIRKGFDSKCAYERALKWREEERARDAQGPDEDRFKALITPLTILERDVALVAHRRAQARREALARFWMVELNQEATASEDERHCSHNVQE
jgi:hypothetical protein